MKGTFWNLCPFALFCADLRTFFAFFALVSDPQKRKNMDLVRNDRVNR